VPIREEQLEQSLHAAAPRVSTVGVLDRVADKRARRRAVRRVELSALAFVVVAALSTVVVLAQDGGRDARVAAPGGKATARVITGPAPVTPNAGTTHAAVPVILDADPGYVRGPLVVSGSALSLAAYDHSGDSFTYPPSRIVQLDDRTFHENGRTNLQAEILSIADGDGARWVVTRNPPPPNGLPDAFLKRVGADGGVSSTLLPPGTDPVGNVAAGGRAVWVPVRDGVVTLDPATGRLGRINLTPSDSRDVVIVNGAAWVTDGNTLRRMDVSGLTSDAQSPGIAGEQLIGVAPAGDTAGWVVLRDAATGRGRATVHSFGGGYLPYLGVLPSGFTPISISATNDRAWVEGTVGGESAVVLLSGAGRVRSTVVLDKGRDASFAWVSDDTLLAVSGGTLLRIDLRK
jgi:hypothetical protein